jgi:hypothetical protein
MQEVRREDPKRGFGLGKIEVILVIIGALAGISAPFFFEVWHGWQEVVVSGRAVTAASR